MSRKNGYMRVPTTEPTPVTQTRMKDMEKRRKLPKSLRPGLFYMFGERGKFAGERGSESEEEIELTEMKGEKRWRRPKIPKSPKSPKSPKLKKAKLKIKYISEPVQDGDTVQRMALRYGVPDSEIRRANNLYTDQDFFALKTVKIPVQEHSILTESAEVEKRRKVVSSGTGGSESNSDEMRLGGPSTYYKSEEEEDSRDADDEKFDSDTAEYRHVSIQSALKWKLSGDSLLKKFDQELERVREDTEQKVQNHRDVAVTLRHPTFYPVTRTSYEKRLLSNIDWRWYVWGGLAIIALIILMLIFRAFWCYYPWQNSSSKHCHLIPVGR